MNISGFLTFLWVERERERECVQARASSCPGRREVWARVRPSEGSLRASGPWVSGSRRWLPSRRRSGVFRRALVFDLFSCACWRRRWPGVWGSRSGGFVCGGRHLPRGCSGLRWPAGSCRGLVWVFFVDFLAAGGSSPLLWLWTFGGLCPRRRRPAGFSALEFSGRLRTGSWRFADLLQEVGRLP